MHKIGILPAIDTEQTDVLGLIIRRDFKRARIGAVIGLALSFSSTQPVSSLL